MSFHTNCKHIIVQTSTEPENVRVNMALRYSHFPVNGSLGNSSRDLGCHVQRRGFQTKWKTGYTKEKITFIGRYVQKNAQSLIASQWNVHAWVQHFVNPSSRQIWKWWSINRHGKPAHLKKMAKEKAKKRSISPCLKFRQERNILFSILSSSMNSIKWSGDI